MYGRCRNCHQFPTCTIPSMRINRSYVASAILNHYSDRFTQVAVIRDHYGLVKVAHEAIAYQVDSKIHIRTFLLGLLHLYRLRQGRAVRIRKRELRHQSGPPHEVSQVNGQIGQCAQGTQVRILSCGCTGVMRRRTHPRREIPDTVDAHIGKQVLAQKRKVKPLVRCTSQRAVVQIESIDVDVCRHCARKCQSHPSGWPGALHPKTQGR